MTQKILGLTLGILLVVVFLVVAVAQDANVCLRPKHTGRCRAYFKRWYWDQSECKCKEFVYGGCDSNGNNFETEAACLQECRRHHCVPPPSDVCMRPAFPGPCRAAFRKWYWDKDDCQCKPFSYGGCQSNGNNFDTREACQETCSNSACHNIFGWA